MILSASAPFDDNATVSAIEFDESDWPLLRINFTAGPNDEEFDAYLRRYDEVYVRRGQRYGLMMVVHAGMPMTKTAHAKQQAEWIGNNEDVVRRLCAGIAFVLPSPLHRGVLRAILWMQGLPVPYKVFDDPQTGRVWLQGLLGEGSQGGPRP